MLQVTQENIRYCLQRAEEARLRASASSEHSEFQQLNCEAERRWLLLAHSYEVVQRIVQGDPHRNV